jgi:hypothetical protein
VDDTSQRRQRPAASRGEPGCEGPASAGGKINKLDNVIVICAGLSDAQETLANNIITDDNTGGTTWANNILNSQAPLKLEDWRFDTSKKIKEAIIFQKLDHLREAGIINHRIAVLHLDVSNVGQVQTC